MKIGNISYLNFKAAEKQDNNGETRTNTDIPQGDVVGASETAKAYFLGSMNANKGIQNAIISPDYDSNQLIFTLKSPEAKAQKIKFVYQIAGDENPREAFCSQKNAKTGEFKVPIPVLNRVNNSIIKNLTITSVQYFDETNLKISEENPENMKINPATQMAIKEPRTTIIDGDVTSTTFDSISEGKSMGKLVEMEYEDMIRYQGNEPIIVALSSKDMDALFYEISAGSFTLPMNVKGIIASPKGYKQGGNLTDCLGHAVSRLRGRKTFAIMEESSFNKIKSTYMNNEDFPYIQIKLGREKMEVSGLKELPKADTSKVNIPKYTLVNKMLTPDDEEFSMESVGLKAFNLGKLKHMQKQGGFIVPKFFVVPAGVWDAVKNAPENAESYGPKKGDVDVIGGYHFCVKKANNSDNPINELKGIRRLIVEDMILPKDVRTGLKEKVKEVFDIPQLLEENGCLIARSSFNGEDSDTMATQGLYDSFPGIRTAEQLYRGVKEVQASKWSDLAYWSRRNHGIDHADIQGNVIVQEVVPVDYTFTINTADPRSNDKNKIVIQLSQGVYSGFPNTPYIFEYDKTTGEITRKAMAQKKRMKPIDKVVMDDFDNLKYDLVNYSNDPLNMSKKEYTPIMKKVFEVAQFIEQKFDGRPQDIEGGIIFKTNEDTGMVEPEIHIWQTRDVHLIKR